ncbi:hypothetical protein HS962_01545 [Pantoea sp. BIGb0393]|uniref:Cell envelope integrity TolA C-terminal domain-containing protein n=1 Tax=Pantoea nemavictus TaxID=2726955 RepID=A0ABU8PMZ3_9GAMM|nr:cell envelope integrity TolA C-terminal domain-containing protein [Pantoea nemavictus]MBA0034927.1 hypothetical protein [Pantoea nemavictus]
MRIFLFAMLLLSGCTTAKHPRTHVVVPPPPVVTDLNSYIAGINYAITTQLFDVDTFAGKTCDVRLDLDDKGQLTDIHVLTGDIGLCTAAMEAAKNAQFPEPPSQEIHRLITHPVLHFAPQK